MPYNDIKSVGANSVLYITTQYGPTTRQELSLSQELGQGSLAGCSSWGSKESDLTEVTEHTQHLARR